MVVYQTLSKRLTQLLSTYIDFDQNQIQLGLWRGDLEIQNVQLKKDALHSILNLWKDNIDNGNNNNNKNSNNNNNRNNNGKYSNDTATSTTTTPTDGNNSHCNNNNSSLLSSFFEKELLLSPNPSPISHLDVKLINGSIDLIKAIVPWKNILLGSKDARVKIKLKGVRIRLGLDSCVRKAIDEEEFGLYGLFSNQSLENDTNTNDSNNDNNNNDNDIHHKKQSKSRQLKQDWIENAQRHFDNKEDIPILESQLQEEDHEKKKHHHRHLSNTTTVIDDNKIMNNSTKQPGETNDSDTDTATTKVSSTFVERFVQSFASNLGWRVGKSLQVEVEDLQIVLVQDDVEIGLVNKALEIFEIDHRFGSDEKKNNSCSDHKVSMHYKEGTNHGEEKCSDHDHDDTSIGLQFKKKYKIDDNSNEVEYCSEPTLYNTTPPPLWKEGDKHNNMIYNALPSSSENNHQTIQKSINVLGCGLFVRNIASTQYIQQWPILDEHILLPTDIGVILTLRRDEAPVAKVSILKGGGMNHSSIDDKDRMQTKTVNDDESDTTFATDSRPKKRRGKRDKRKHDDNLSLGMNATRKEESFETVKSDYMTIDSTSRCNTTIPPALKMEEYFSKPHVLNDQTLPQFSTQIIINNVIVVLSTYNCVLFNAFMSNVNKLLIGRPCQSIQIVNEIPNTEESVALDDVEVTVKSDSANIRKWWSYVMFNVLRSVRKKKFLRLAMNPNEEKFSWQQYQRLKREYISLFTRLRLNKLNKNPNKDELSVFHYTFGMHDEEKLLALEDKLTIEQIILFRTFARHKRERDKSRITTPDGLPSSLFPMLDLNFQNVSPISFAKSSINESTTKIFESTEKDFFRLKNTHRRHVSLFNIDDRPDVTEGHRRGQTVTYDNLAISKPKLRATKSEELPPADEVVSTQETWDIKSAVDGIEEDPEPAFQGKISSLVTCSVVSLQFFICMKAVLKDGKQDDLEYEIHDDVSILTTNTFDNDRSNEMLVENDYYNPLEDRRRFVSIFGQPHEVLFTSIVYQTKIHSEKNLEKTRNVAEIEGICARMLDSSSFSSGKLNLLDNYQSNTNERSHILTVDKFILQPFYTIEKTKEKFFSAEIVNADSQIIDDVLQIKAGGASFHLQSCIAKVYITINCNSIPKICDFMGMAGFPKHNSYPSKFMSTFDHHRQQVLQQKLRFASKIVSTAPFEFFFDLRGFDLSLRASDDGDQTSPQPLNHGYKDTNLSVKCGSILLHQGSHSQRINTNPIFERKESSAMKAFLETFPDSGFSNLFCTLLNISIESGSLSILNEVKSIDILLSSAKQRSDSVDSDIQSAYNISVSVAPVTLLVSKYRIMKVKHIFDVVNAILQKYRTEGDSSFLDQGPRIAEFAKISLSKARVFSSSVEILLIGDIEHMHRDNSDWKVRLEEIMKSFLIQKLSLIKYNGMERSEAIRAVFNIAVNRLEGLNFVDHEANSILQQLSDKADSLQIGNFSESAEMGNILRKAIDTVIESFISRNIHVARSTSFISLCFGFHIYIDKLTYDWRLSLSITSLMLRSKTGVSLLKVTPNSNILDSASADNGKEQEISIPNEDEAISANIVWKTSKFAFGEGGAPMSVYAEDRLITSTWESEPKEVLSFFNIGLMDILFVEDEVLSVLNVISSFNEHKYGHCGESQHTPNTASISGSISRFNLICCAKEFQPFTKVSLLDVSVDASSSQSLFYGGKSLLITASSKSAEILDLTVDGLIYDRVVFGVAEKNQDSVYPFTVKLAISSDERVTPNELLVAFSKSKILLLRRFLNEFLEFLFSPDHGIGRVLDQCSGQEIEDVKQPLRFQIHLLDSSIILPKSSDSDDMIALSSSKFILSNSFEKKSWTTPIVNTGCSGHYDNHISNIGKNAVESITNYLVDCMPFDKSLVSRISTIVKNANIFTGISRKGYQNSADHARTYCNLKHNIGIGEVCDGSMTFFIRPNEEGAPNMNDQDCEMISELLERRWEKVNTLPIFVEVITDFLPSHMRVLINDTQTNDLGAHAPFSLDLRMSQFYTILSVWYQNMQELPMLFPYSSEFIGSNASLPEFPSNWPEYGSEEYVKRMCSLNKVTFELALSITTLEWYCKFDNEDYFEKTLGTAFMMNASTNEEIILRAKNLTVQIDSDSDGVMRIGLGATSLNLDDKRHNHTAYPCAFNISQGRRYMNNCASIDMTWGLRCGKNISSNDLGFPFQMSVFMTPDRWCLVNLGMEDLNTCTADLGFLWVLLDYLSAYFSYHEFGNPYFLAKTCCDGFVNDILDVKLENDLDTLNLDFRLWLLRPCVSVLCDPIDVRSPIFVIKSREHGLFYRYKTIGTEFVSQEIHCHYLDMLKLDSCDELNSNIRETLSSEKWITMLFRSLNMSLLYEQNTKSNHSDIHVEISHFTNEIGGKNGIEFAPVIVKPVDVPLPTICKPSFTPSNQLGPISCEIELMNPDDFIMASETLLKFAGPFAEEESGDECMSDLPEDDNPSYCRSLNVRGAKVFISDPLLGIHLPVVVVNIPCLKINCSQLYCMKDQWKGVSNATDWQTFIDAHLWVDYFKSGPTRSWEPLVEPYKCVILIEKSSRRGHGITVSSECPFHINLSGAFFETLAFAARSFAPYALHLLGIREEEISAKDKGKKGTNDLNLRLSHVSVHEDLQLMGFDDKIKHEKVASLHAAEPAAFSLINLTGNEVRFHQHERRDSEKYIQYLHHGGVAALSFPATRSLVVNLQIVEIPVYKNGEQIINDATSGRVDSSNYIDVQIPGFCWTKSISVDITGKRFIGLQSKSTPIQKKLSSDWRLANAFSLLTDVSFYDGGRQVTLSSCFEVLNKTSHTIELASHPNPFHISRMKNKNNHERKLSDNDKVDNLSDSRLNDCFIEIMNPGETIQVPFFLLQSSLQEKGENLGSFWLRPKERDEFFESLDVPGLENSSIRFCSSPIQLMHVVNDSASMFAESGGNLFGAESFSSGYQLSCPIVLEAEESIVPFCYCVEIKRSPLVEPFTGHEVSSVAYDVENSHDTQIDAAKPNETVSERPESLSNKSSASKKTVGRDTKKFKGLSHPTDFIHGPVAYSLEIHPPLVIENLLPERARYELMHATRKLVVWWSDLMPGESIPVYTVGLDAPLLLLIHLGYCRTPVGEGALVHHGSVSRNTNYVYEKATINADNVINAITKLNMTSEERTATIVSRFQDVDTVGRKVVNNKKVYEDTLHSSAAEDREQPFHQIFTIHDIATETIVVDHIGQKLNLYIENKLGGGGQRHITIYCPYWIINTTEHALRYRQEKTSTFVSGTMISESNDGSRFVDLGDKPLFDGEASANFGTIFPGKPGALADPKLHVDQFASLMEKDMPLDLVASMAFMFNFRDILSIGGYERKLCIQLADPGGSKYTSDWSHGVSLESVGVSQTISMHCMDGRQLELAMTTRVAPGKLSKFTKFVRLSPKYVLVNQLTRPIRLWQDSSLVHPSRTLDGFKSTNNRVANWTERRKERRPNEEMRKYDFLFGDVSQLDYRRGTKMRPGTVADKSAFYITTVGKGELIPFHLPDTKFERELRIDLGRKFNLTASFPSDIISDHTLKLTPVVDLRLLKHVDNRASARYTVKLPPQDESEESMGSWDGELGIWFETIQWSHGTKIVVKGTKRGKYSINNTDIHVGDELVQIDEKLVSQMTFAETMKMLKERLSQVLDTYRSSKLQFVRNQSNHATLTKHKKHKLFLKRFTNNNQVAHGQFTPIAKEKELILVFQTLEHRMKRLRGKALGRKNVSSMMRGNVSVPRSRTLSGHSKDKVKVSGILAPHNPDEKGIQDEINLVNHDEDDTIQVTLKHLNQTIFVFVHDVNSYSPYRIENRSVDYVIYFRQRGCEHHQWNSLSPGDEMDYTLEEPMKPHKLTVRVGFHHKQFVMDTSKIVKNIFPFKFIEKEEYAGFGPSRTIRLDEIGFVDSLSCPITAERDIRSLLHCYISAEGKTKKLVISDHKDSTKSGELVSLEKHLQNLMKHISEENKRLEALVTLKRKNDTVPWKSKKVEDAKNANMNSSSLPTVKEDEIVTESTEQDGISTKVTADDLEKEIVETADNPDVDTIVSRHQVLVEIIEAAGLINPTSESGRLCSPYCTIRVTRRFKKHRANIFAKSDEENVRRTYYIEKSDSPRWSGMRFIFNVSAEAESDPHSYSILVKMKDNRLIGKNASIGMTEIRLRNLKHQKEVIGWYPLMARTGSGSEIYAAGTGRGRGSVKIRVQWIYSVPALLNYYINLSENRIMDITTNCERIKEQLENLKIVGYEDAEMSRSSMVISKSKSLRKEQNRKARTFLRRNRQKEKEEEVGTTTNLTEFPDDHGLYQESQYQSDNKSLESSFESIGAIDDSSAPNIHRPFGGDEENAVDSINGVLSQLSLFQAKTWVQASEFLNHPTVKRIRRRDFSDSIIPKVVDSKEAISQCPLILPLSAPRLMQKRKDEYLKILQTSRETFEKAAQRSLRAVSNPGGWLKIRPITALYLPANGYTGMYVKVVYGSESIVSQTVPTPVNPEWTQESGYDENIKCRDIPLNRQPYDNIVDELLRPNFLEKDDSFVFSPRSEENDLEINVQALKTSGYLRLSVVGVKRRNFKEELGVLHIPLADAICCCTEKFDGEYKSANSYVRWFPLSDPKWMDAGDFDIRDNQKSVITEKKDSSVFSQNYTKCIKLAMWWEKDETNTLHINDIESNHVSQPVVESYFNASINGISAAVIDSFRAKELISIAFTNIDVRILFTTPRNWLGLAVGSIQIDQHDEAALEPVVLSATPVMHPQPTIRFLAERDNMKSKNNINSFKHVHFQLEELNVQIEDSWLFELWEMYSRLRQRYKVMQKSITRRTLCRSLIETPNFHENFSTNPEVMIRSTEVEDAINETNRDKKDIEAEEKTTKKLYIDELMLGSVKLNISFTKSLRGKFESPSDRKYDSMKKNLSMNHRAEIFRRWSEFGYDEDLGTHSIGSSTNFPVFISTIFPAISDAPVHVNGKVLNTVFVTWDELFATLKNYYVKEIMMQFYKIIGSLDIVGNPTMVVNSMLKGARDFVVIPLREFVRSPQNPSRLGIGVAKGSLSLFSHFFSGVFGFVSNVSEAVGSGVATLSLDEYFKRWHAEQVANHARYRNMKGQFRPQTASIIGSAVTRPLQDILAGALFAATGLIVEPYVGARTDGARGFAKGLGIGTIGVVTKPIVGFFDACAHVSHSINDAARSINIFEKKFKPVKKRRYPYIFGCDNILLSYNAIHARTVSLLHLFTVDDGVSSNEVLVISELLLLYPGEATYLAVTTKRIVLFEVQMNREGQPKKVWQIDFDKETKVISSLENYRHSGYVLRIHRQPNEEHLHDLDRMGNIDVSNDADDELIDHHASSPNSAKYVNKLNIWEGENIKRIYEQAGALLPNAGFSGKQDNRKQVYAEVFAEFTYNKELTRVHNAICCLTRRFFDLIISRSGTTENNTSFGNMHFVEEDIANTKNNGDNSLSLFEDVPWVHFEELDNTLLNDITMLRRKWLYSDELNVFEKKGGPKWVIESRAQSSFVPMPFPPLPPSLSFETVPELKTVKTKLEKGLISLEDAELSIEKIAESDEIEANEHFSSAHDIPYEKQESNSVFPFASAHELSSVKLENNRNNSNFFQLYGPSVMESTKSLVINESNDYSETFGNKAISAEQRLANVEQMLLTLISQTSVAPNSFAQTHQSSATRATPTRSSHFSSGLSMVSALSNSDNAFDNSFLKEKELKENKELRKEIEALKLQLAIAQQQQPFNIMDETTSTSISAARAKKKRRRKFMKKTK